MVRQAFHERSLLEQGMEELRRILGEAWEITPLNTGKPVGGNDVAEPDLRIDMVWTVRHLTSHTPAGAMLVEAKTNLSPAVAARVLEPQASLMRQLPGQAAVLVVAPWLSPRTREVLDRRDFGYLDLTGNVSIKLSQPAIFIRTEGEQRSPVPEHRGRRGLSGSRAARLVRELVDFEPPRRANELAKATEISESYVSRLLDSMSDEALIMRDGRVITDVDWPALLRARAASYELLRANRAVAVVARQGRNRLLDALRMNKNRHRVLLTGSFAAEAIAPTTVGGPLMLYVPPGPQVVDEVAQDLALLRTGDHQGRGSASDVMLLQPTSDEAFDRPQRERVDGVECVGLSQLVLDCLSGPGRMPAEGEAVLAWMQAHEGDWREASPLAERSGAVG
jgi:hypothetical protein